jgi:hypothetical protein
MQEEYGIHKIYRFRYFILLRILQQTVTLSIKNETKSSAFNRIKTAQFLRHLLYKIRKVGYHKRQNTSVYEAQGTYIPGV